MNSSQNRGINLWNIITVMLIGLLVIACLLFVLVLAQPSLLPEPIANLLPSAPEPTTAVVVDVPTRASAASVPEATDTAAPLPVDDLAPTFTPLALATANVAPGATLRPTEQPTETPILPSRTATPTWTPSPTNTPIGTETFTPSPTNTRSPFQFTKTVDVPRYDEQRFYDIGCSWMGFAGQIFGLDGNPISGTYRVHVWEDRPNGIDKRAVVGDAPIYGAAGWEQFVGSEPFVWTFFLQLESGDGTPLSQVYSVQTRASCRENLIYFNFIQNY